MIRTLLIIFNSDYRNANLDIVEQYETYEDYLDSQLTPTDLDYLEDEELARQLVELGYRGLGDTLHRDVCINVSVVANICIFSPCLSYYVGF